jgi:hypothetical protein
MSHEVEGYALMVTTAKKMMTHRNSLRRMFTAGRARNAAAGAAALTAVAA